MAWLIAAGVVLIGTIYPLIVRRAAASSVGPPFFNMTVVPLLGLLFLVLPLGPMLTWRVGDDAHGARSSCACGRVGADYFGDGAGAVAMANGRRLGWRSACG